MAIAVYAFFPIGLDQEIRVTIPQGYSVSQSAQELHDAGVIRSSYALIFLSKFEKVSFKAGTYLFEDQVSLAEVMKRLKKGDYGDVYLRITLPEGSSNEEMSRIFASELENFDASLFKQLAEDKEGYLFPDTYLVLPEVSTEELVLMLEERFKRVINPLLPAIETSSHSLHDIIIMASLLEKEASDDEEEQKIISGILWKRLDKGMPLQVDAPFLYLKGKTSAELSHNDLRADNPYNTYTRRGLPPHPIGNPGLQTITAALNPIESLYFYYLHDTKGGIHYGVNHDEHVKNKRRYLRK